MRKLTFTAEFVEFDSRNLSHAGAHYEVEVWGKREDVGDDEPEQLDLL